MQFSPLIKSLRLTTIVCVVLLSSLPALTDANAFSQRAVNAGEESNVPRALDGHNEKESRFTELEYSFGKLYEMGAKNTLILSAAVSSAKFTDLRGFDRVGLSVAANYNYKWALGAYAPVVSLITSYGVSNIVSEASKNDAPDFAYRELDIVCVAGKTQSVRIFELLGEPAQLSDKKKEEVALFAEALRHYRAQNWNEAAEMFSQLQIKCDNAQLSQLFLDRIAKFRETSPGLD